MTVNLNSTVPHGYAAEDPLEVPDSHGIGAGQSSKEGSRDTGSKRTCKEDVPDHQTNDQASDTLEERARWLLIDIYLPQSMRNATRAEKTEYLIRKKDIENRQRWGYSIAAVVFANLLTTACNWRHKEEASQIGGEFLPTERKSWKAWLWKKAVYLTDRFPWFPRFEPISLWIPTRWGADLETIQAWFADLEPRYPTWMAEHKFTWDEWERWYEHELHIPVDMVRAADIAWRMHLFPLFGILPCFALIILGLGFKVSEGSYLTFAYLLSTFIRVTAFWLIESVYLMHLRLLDAMSEGLMCLFLLNIAPFGVVIKRIVSESPESG